MSNLAWNLRTLARWLVILVMLAASPFSTKAAPRIALLDFTADDNSWPSSLAAVDFTAALQARLSGETDVAWVEREQLKLAEGELHLTELGRMAGSDAVDEDGGERCFFCQLFLAECLALPIAANVLAQSQAVFRAGRHACYPSRKGLLLLLHTLTSLAF